MSNEGLKFSLSRQKVSVELTGEDGLPVRYWIQALTGQERDEFLNVVASKTRYNEAGQPVGVRDHNGIQSGLLARAMVTDGGIALPEKTIKGWPAKVVTELFRQAQLLSGLREAEVKEEKPEGNP